MGSINSQLYGAPQPPSTRPPLLALPAELRNAIYEYVAIDVATVEIVHGGCVKNRPGLLAVSPQIRDEAVPIFLHNVLCTEGSITSTVHNFDFSHLIAFFTHAIQHGDQQISTRNYIRLQLTMDENWQTGKEALTRWLRFVGDGCMTLTSVYRCEGWVPERDPAWYADTEAAIFAQRGHKTYQAYQASHVARKEWQEIESVWAWQAVWGGAERKG
ncbi:hypothetical protein LTR36_001617 [Oleoguttula mirabilis]|uniref:Uncharacterized protein n=1 Tax=Oleoguttula mirabilis TaxID=1507867 RepID=A0AAV9JMV9_9PEZI|nr:hypothetical protein LTR36_001617 [Oleoguttula mirabilis]